jgi:hypothetical protein
MTPRQFSLLSARHREALAHIELVHGWTTAAVINYAFSAPEKPASALDFMPNHNEHEHPNAEPEIDEEQMEAKAAYQQQVLQLAAEMKAQSGSIYDRICLGRT